MSAVFIIALALALGIDAETYPAMVLQLAAVLVVIGSGLLMEDSL